MTPVTPEQAPAALRTVAQYVGVWADDDVAGKLLEIANVLEEREARLKELLEATHDEKRRSSITSLPQKLVMAEVLGLPLADMDEWMKRTRHRFVAAVALFPEENKA